MLNVLGSIGALPMSPSNWDPWRLSPNVVFSTTSRILTVEPGHLRILSDIHDSTELKPVVAESGQTWNPFQIDAYIPFDRDVRKLVNLSGTVFHPCYCTIHRSWMIFLCRSRRIWKTSSGSKRPRNHGATGTRDLATGGASRGHRLAEN